MPNTLDELSGPINTEGRDINVINKQIPVQVGIESLILEIGVWTTLPIILLLALSTNSIPSKYIPFYVVLGFIPGIVFWLMKQNARSYFQQLEQKVQADASQIDNYLEQRVIVLNNVVGLLNKAIDLDKDVMKTVTALRAGGSAGDDASRNATAQKLDGVLSSINVAFEAYPDLKAHKAISGAMEQNSYLQREITAARDLYNDTVAQWNRDVMNWPTKQMVAARLGYTTRIPFIASAETKGAARRTYF